MKQSLSRFKPKVRKSKVVRRGAAATEFAMVAPVFVLVIIFCAEFARLSLLRNLSQHAAYEAARSVITEGTSVEDGIARANQILGRLGTVSAIVRINNSQGTADPPDSGNSGGGQPIDFNTLSVKCSIEIPLKDNTTFLPAAMLGDHKIVSEISLRTERYQGFYDGVSVQ